MDVSNQELVPMATHFPLAPRCIVGDPEVTKSANAVEGYQLDDVLDYLSVEAQDDWVDDRTVAISTAWYLVPRLFFAWPQLRLAVVDVRRGQARFVNNVHETHVRRNFPRGAGYHYLFALRARFCDSVHHVSTVLLEVSEDVFLVLYKQLCIDWMTYRFQISLNDVPLRLLKLSGRLEAAWLGGCQPDWLQMSWETLVRMTASIAGVCRRCRQRLSQDECSTCCSVCRFKFGAGGLRPCAPPRQEGGTLFRDFKIFVDTARARVLDEGALNGYHCACRLAIAPKQLVST